MEESRCMFPQNDTCGLCFFRYTGKQCELDLFEDNISTQMYFYGYQIITYFECAIVFIFALVALFNTFKTKGLRITHVMVLSPIFTLLFCIARFVEFIDPYLYGTVPFMVTSILRSVATTFYLLVLFSMMILWLDTMLKIEKKMIVDTATFLRKLIIVMGVVFVILAISSEVLAILFGGLWHVMINFVVLTFLMGLLVLCIYTIVKTEDVVGTHIRKSSLILKFVAVTLLVQIFVTGLNIAFILVIGSESILMQVCCYAILVMLECVSICIMLIQVIQTMRPIDSSSRTKSKKKTKSKSKGTSYSKVEDGGVSKTSQSAI